MLYEWSDLDGAEQHGQQALELARQDKSVIDRFASCEVFLARLKLAQGDAAGATSMLARVEQSVRQHNFVHRRQEVAAARLDALGEQELKVLINDYVREEALHREALAAVERALRQLGGEGPA